METRFVTVGKGSEKKTRMNLNGSIRIGDINVNSILLVDREIEKINTNIKGYVLCACICFIYIYSICLDINR